MLITPYEAGTNMVRRRYLLNTDQGFVKIQVLPAMPV